MATKTLYVGNLPYSTTEEDLFQHFADYNPVNARILEGRGYAFLDVDADKVGDAIEAKHNSEIGGRKLTVNEARPRGEGGGGGNRDFRGGNGGGGGGRGGYGGGGGGGYGGGGGGGGRKGGGGGRSGGRW